MHSRHHSGRGRSAVRASSHSAGTSHRMISQNGDADPTLTQGWDWLSIAAAVATVAVVLLTLLTTIGTFISRRARQRLPPGPRGWPILGSLLSLGTLPHQKLYELSKQYGPLMFIRLGSVGTVVVTSPQVAEEVLKTNDLIMCSRPETIVSQRIMYGGVDIAWAPYGQYWRYLRKICTVGLLTATRITQFREIREREVLAGLHFILEESKRGNAVNMIGCFTTIAMNNITQMMMNKSFSSFQASDSKITSSGQSFQDMLLLLGAFNFADFVPILKPFDPQGFDKRISDVHGRLDACLEEIIEEHRQIRSTAIRENYKEDFVDALLGLGQTKELQEQLSMDSIKAFLLDILAGGTDTSSVSALWALTQLIRNTCMMRRVQEELDSVVGPHRLVQEEDLPQLKYLHAVIKEALRLHPPVPTLIPHESTHDCEIHGFHIPAKTRILVNVWGIHRDPAVWERPQEFNPERFLNSTVDFKGHDFELLPFGSGRRICPGMNLGSLMILYPLAVLLHAVDWTLPEGQKPEELDISEIFGMVLLKKVPLTVFGRARLEHHIIYPAK